MKVYDIKYSNLFYEGIWYQVFQSIFMKVYDIKYSNLFFLRLLDTHFSSFKISNKNILKNFLKI